MPAICTAALAPSSPLLPDFPPERSIAWLTSSVVKTEKTKEKKEKTKDKFKTKKTYLKRKINTWARQQII